MKNDNRGFIYIPQWMQYFMIACLVVGAATIFFGTIAAIVWAFNHIKII